VFGPWASASVPVAGAPAEAIDETDVVAGGWFGWLGYPDGPPTNDGDNASDADLPVGSHWFGFYPHVLRYRRAEQRWVDEALLGVVDDDELAARRASLAGLLHAQPSADGGYRVGDLTSATSRSDYTAAVERCIEHIRAGEIYQANICLRLDATFSGDVVALFVDLLTALHPAYAALVCDDHGAVVSMSPELYLHRRARTVLSAPIKGTRPRSPGGPTPDPEAARLRNSAKERAENVMIVDLVRNDLARVAETGSVTVPTLLRVEQHCGVWHLVSRVAATVPSYVDNLSLVRATFPPGSVTGAPKLAARTVIDRLERQPRGVYTGAVGYLGVGGDLQLSVAIRTLRIVNGVDGVDGTLTLGVGAGITAESTPVREWRECFDKAAPLAAAMGARIAVPDTNSVLGAESIRMHDAILVLRGQPVELDAHLDQLGRSLAELWDTEPPALLRDHILRAAAAIQPASARLLLYLERHAGRPPRFRTADSPVPMPIEVISQPGASLELAALPDGFGRHKRAHPTLPAERVVLATDGVHCLGTAVGNVLVFRGNQVITPPLDGRVIPGVTRRAVLTVARGAGLDVRVRALPVEELLAADGVVVCDSIAGLTWIRRCSRRSWAQPTSAMAAPSCALLTQWGVGLASGARLAEESA
jgi:para-aminobenzoate synthetase/4-amino-4-deoxychorismate lyase